MSGPYDYVPPDYWLLDTKAGGAYGFNTESSPGPAVPSLEELKTFIPEDKLWPISDAWNFHAGGGEFKTSICSLTRSKCATEKQKAPPTTHGNRKP